MAHAKQNLPRALRQPASARSATPIRSRRRLWVLIGLACLLVYIVGVATFILLDRTTSLAVSEARVTREVSALLTGIPQQGATLGQSAAPVTLEVFADLKDPDSRNWFLDYLPAILRQDVRTGQLKLRFRAYKTNTREPEEFVKEQTAALAAGAQGKLWNYAYTFFYEQRSEFSTYVTESHLENIARQVPGLNLSQWHTDLHTGRREEQAVMEDQTARALALHVTPSFRIGRTGGPMKNYSGHSVVKYGDQHPIALPEASDVDKAIEELGINL